MPAPMLTSVLSAKGPLIRRPWFQKRLMMLSGGGFKTREVVKAQRTNQRPMDRGELMDTNSYVFRRAPGQGSWQTTTPSLAKVVVLEVLKLTLPK